jgi:hypothetical protein
MTPEQREATRSLCDLVLPWRESLLPSPLFKSAHEIVAALAPEPSHFGEPYATAEKHVKKLLDGLEALWDAAIPSTRRPALNSHELHSMHRDLSTAWARVREAFEGQT